MKTILVTGGAGLVGSHACKALLRGGYLPVTFLERGHERAVKWGPLEPRRPSNPAIPEAGIAERFLSCEF
ncbi:MAG TPA: NAD-dependent epimerase/dehydratase family protein [Streptosporangiaceae bacterium]|nr:NAD-dependent epimerase/dehydratase family protein [Streptosporangiaceae bacterium]